MRVTVRRFDRADIPDKVRWINDPDNNRFLHYDLPLTVEKTEKWYERVSRDPSRYDAVIEADGVPCGLIGVVYSLRVLQLRKNHDGSPVSASKYAKIWLALAVVYFLLIRVPFFLRMRFS